MGAVFHHLLNDCRVRLVTNLENVLVIDVAEALVSRLQVVEAVPHVCIGRIERDDIMGFVSFTRKKSISRDCLPARANFFFSVASRALSGQFIPVENITELSHISIKALKYGA